MFLLAALIDFYLACQKRHMLIVNLQFIIWKSLQNIVSDYNHKFIKYKAKTKGKSAQFAFVCGLILVQLARN